MLLVRFRESANDGRRASLPFGLAGGLRDLFLGELLREEESSDVDIKCLEVISGIGGANAGDWTESPYLEVFRRTTLGGELLPVGVVTGDAR